MHGCGPEGWDRGTVGPWEGLLSVEVVCSCFFGRWINWLQPAGPIQLGHQAQDNNSGGIIKSCPERDAMPLRRVRCQDSLALSLGCSATLSQPSSFKVAIDLFPLLWFFPLTTTLTVLAILVLNNWS